MKYAHNSSESSSTQHQRGTKADSDATTRHRSVLLQETLSLLDIAEDDVVLDATLGGGGHASAIAELLGVNGHLIGIDTDGAAITRSRSRLEGVAPKLTMVQGNFRNLDSLLAKIKVAEANKVLFDLGWSSDQLEDSGRGFSFLRDEPLLMTLSGDPSGQTLTAREIVNSWDEENIADILYHYADERASRKIARAIVEHREKNAIETTTQLAELIESAVSRRGKVHPATKTFQALRITVNDEIAALKEGLEHACQHLADSGRVAVISFHSLEDRVVKEAFRQWAKIGRGEILTKKPMVPTREEIQGNPRSRSAKLRAFKKHTHHATE